MLLLLPPLLAVVVVVAVDVSIGAVVVVACGHFIAPATAAAVAVDFLVFCQLF